MKMAATLPILLSLLATAPVPSAPPSPLLQDGGATVSGKVRFEGKLPAKWKDKKIDVAADPYCSSTSPDGHLTEVFRINDKGEVQNVFVWIQKGLEGKNFPLPAGTVLLDQVGCRYVPHVLGVRVGQGLLIRNSDATMHNIHSTSKANQEFNFGQPQKGAETVKTFEAPEVMVKMKCDVHGWMGAYVGVVSHPFFAVSGEGGDFQLKDLPPGDYEVGAWHEKFGTLTQSLKIEGPGAKELSFTFTNAKEK